MRVTLLPRDVASRVITGAVSVLAYSCGLTIVLLAIPVLIESFARRGQLEQATVPFFFLVVMAGAIAVCLWRPGRLITIAYLVVGSALAAGYEISVLRVDPTLLETERFLVNRPTLALVAIGVASTSALAGLLWCVAGYLAANVVAAIAATVTSTPFDPGFGPTLVLMLAAVLYLTLFAIQARQRRRVPSFDELEEATRRRAAGADLAQRTTAIVHDTVLNDLTVVMNAPDTLNWRARERLLEDLATLEGGDWMRATSEVAKPDATQARTRNDFARLASDFRWRGLDVNVTGNTTGVYRYAPAAGEALVGATRAALENVLRHSGATSAEVTIMYTDREVTLMVSDQGVGFDPDAVDARRLGIRGSIVSRIEAVGGRTQVWSQPGTGTTVMISIPVLSVVDPGVPARHQEDPDG